MPCVWCWIEAHSSDPDVILAVCVEVRVTSVTVVVVDICMPSTCICTCPNSCSKITIFLEQKNQFQFIM